MAELKVKRDFDEKPVRIRSLVTYDSTQKCATATFVYEADYSLVIL